jgi:hypothetical protein
MDRLSALLGNSNIKVTEKHDSPWVRARQEQLEAGVNRSWENELPKAFALSVRLPPAVGV